MLLTLEWEGEGFLPVLSAGRSKLEEDGVCVTCEGGGGGLGSVAAAAVADLDNSATVAVEVGVVVDGVVVVLLTVLLLILRSGLCRGPGSISCSMNFSMESWKSDPNM
jgi:hypothetical protein